MDPTWLVWIMFVEIVGKILGVVLEGRYEGISGGNLGLTCHLIDFEI
jgi:hypothetical protein